MKREKSVGLLYVVATPIGNLGDMTERALATLRDVTRIAAEDTRHAQHLLSHYHIQKPLISLHQVNEAERVALMLSYLSAGDDIALISDAGTPLISDPGFSLVTAVQAAGGRVIPIPGACALITALCASGLPTHRFAFEGFLSAKAGSRKAHLNTLLQETRTLVFYESPHRIMTMLNDILTVFGETRQVVVARELTKLYEEFIHGTPGMVIKHFEQHPETIRGEFVVLLAGAKEEKHVNDEAGHQKVLHILLDELPTKQAVHLAHQLTGLRKNRLYELALLYRAD